MGSSCLVLASALALVLQGARCAGPPDDALCKLCDCPSDAVLNCTNRGRTELPAADSGAWPMGAVEAYFEHDEITEVTPLPNMTSLRRLSLRFNRIDRIAYGAFQNLSSLEEIDLSNNELTSDGLNGELFKGQYKAPDFLPLGNMSVLRLDSNLLHSLRSEVFEHLPHLTVLSLAFNELRILDTSTVSAISSLTQLQVLDLSFCSLKTLPEFLLHTPLKLRELNVTGNIFTMVPSALQYSHSLKVLRLSQNPIRDIVEGSFPKELSELEVLELDYMDELRVIGPAAFATLKSLRELYVSHSKRLQKISANAFVSEETNSSQVPLEKLVLRGNALKSLDKSLLGARWGQLKYLDLEDNAWECDCHTQWMVEKLEDVVNRTHPNLLVNVVCEDPEPMRGRSFFELHQREYHLRCLDAAGARPDRDGLLLVGVLVGVLLAVPATLAAVLCWKRGACSWLGGKSLSPTRAFYTRARSTIDESY